MRRAAVDNDDETEDDELEVQGGSEIMLSESEAEDEDAVSKLASAVSAAVTAAGTPGQASFSLRRDKSAHKLLLSALDDLGIGRSDHGDMWDELVLQVWTQEEEGREEALMRELESWADMRVL
ncbi:hypothetical protein JCM11641_004185 [Rhodosporidiobolus odoratus]